jgi:dTDP-4-dehydrorhamnose 3,5-epimerase
VLSSENRKQLMVPRGFAHGFLTLTDDVAFCYKLDNFYDPQAEMQIRWNDPDINAAWGIGNPLLSEKDANAPFFKAIENFLE